MKNWYSKERLEEEKKRLNDKRITQEEYDQFEEKMKTFNLDEKEIVDRTIEYFLTIPEEQEVAFTKILSECFPFNALSFFSGSILWKLYKSFMSECTKRKIKIIFHDFYGPVGVPYNLGFWRTSKPIIKKIIYNESYSCWGAAGELNRTYIIFEKNKITYCREPLKKCSSISNCDVKVSFEPKPYWECDFSNIIASYDFKDICDISEKILNEHV